MQWAILYIKIIFPVYLYQWITAKHFCTRCPWLSQKAEDIRRRRRLQVRSNKTQVRACGFSRISWYKASVNCQLQPFREQRWIQSICTAAISFKRGIWYEDENGNIWYIWFVYICFSSPSFSSLSPLSFNYNRGKKSKNLRVIIFLSTNLNLYLKRLLLSKWGTLSVKNTLIDQMIIIII